VIDQGARLVDIALEDGSAFKLDGWKYIKESFAEHTLHFIGLLSDGGVHSRINQLLRARKKLRLCQWLMTLPQQGIAKFCAT